MKKLFLTLSVVFAGLLVSCGHKQNDTTVDEIDTVAVEEVVTDSVECDSTASNSAEVVPTETTEETVAE